MKAIASVVGFDPGGTTGWAVASVDFLKLIRQKVDPVRNLRHWESGQFTGCMEEQIEDCAQLIDAWPSAAVASEAFQLQQLAVELSPVEINAGIKYVCWLGRREEQLFLQSRNLSKSTATNDRLKTWGLYKPGEQHGRDALRVGVTFLRRCYETPGLIAKAWPKLYEEYHG